MYIDPNAGGMIYQSFAFVGICGGIFAIFMAGVLAIVLYFKKGKKK